VRFRKGRGYGVYAAADISEGELIFQHEAKRTFIASRSFVEAQLQTPDADVYRSYAYPISRQLYATWSDDPKDWLPINHSCDPSAWLHGLDVVARRDMRGGVEVTLDYATFTSAMAKPFDCACGAATCRGVVRGGDVEVARRYGKHVTPFIAALVRRGGVSGADDL
jgi:hypothetical protein